MVILEVIREPKLPLEGRGDERPKVNERASLVPAAAVIPALKMHRIIAAVKKLVGGPVP